MTAPSHEDVLPRLARMEAAEHARSGTFGEVGEVERFGPLTAVYAGPGLPVNTGWHDGTRAPGEADLVAFEGFCTAHGQPATLHVLSHAAPRLLAPLASRGYALTGVLHVYTRPLTALPAPPSLTVGEEADADAWAALAAQAFGPGSEAIMRLNARLPGSHRLVGRVEGTPAGVGVLSVGGGVAAFYSAATLPQWRERGVQTALLAARLHLAARLGADLASVFVTPESGSERNVRRAGFGVAGARLTFTRAEV